MQGDSMEMGSVHPIQTLLFCQNADGILSRE